MPPCENLVVPTEFSNIKNASYNMKKIDYKLTLGWEILFEADCIYYKRNLYKGSGNTLANTSECGSNEYNSVNGKELSHEFLKVLCIAFGQHSVTLFDGTWDSGYTGLEKRSNCICTTKISHNCWFGKEGYDYRVIVGNCCVYKCSPELARKNKKEKSLVSFVDNKRICVLETCCNIITSLKTTANKSGFCGEECLTLRKNNFGECYRCHKNKTRHETLLICEECYYKKLNNGGICRTCKEDMHARDEDDLCPICICKVKNNPGVCKLCIQVCGKRKRGTNICHVCTNKARCSKCDCVFLPSNKFACFCITCQLIEKCLTCTKDFKQCATWMKYCTSCYIDRKK